MYNLHLNNYLMELNNGKAMQRGVIVHASFIAQKEKKVKGVDDSCQGNMRTFHIFMVAEQHRNNGIFTIMETIFH